jgi:hypothetical protein
MPSRSFRHRQVGDDEIEPRRIFAEPGDGFTGLVARGNLIIQSAQFFFNMEVKAGSSPSTRIFWP